MPTPDETKAAAKESKAPPRYTVMSGGVTGADGAGYYRGAVVTSAQLGSAARVASLLAKGAIEVVDDATE